LNKSCTQREGFDSEGVREFGLPAVLEPQWNLKGGFMADNITGAFIRARSWQARLGSKRQIDLWDEQRGLVLRVSKAKSEDREQEGETFTWCVVYRNKRGQKRRWGLGRWPDLDYKDARNLAAQVQGDIARGIDPVERKRDEMAERRQRQTVADLAKLYIEEHCASCKRPSSTRTDKLMLDADVLPVIGRKRAADITREDIAWLLKQVENRGNKERRGNRVRSNRVRSVISSMFTYGVEERFIPANPAAGLGRRHKEYPRERRLNDDEIRKLWEVLGEGDVADQYRLMLLTAQRPGEVARVEWHEIDLRGAWWTIPGDKSKNHQAHRIALGPQALEILQHRNPQRTGYVFPKAAKDRSIPSWRQAKIEEACGFAMPWQPRDLRRTAGSEIASEFGRSVMSHVLNHTDRSAPAVSRVYDQHDYDREKQRAMQWLDGRIKAIVTGEKPSDNVIPFPGGAIAS
jgi:integrase